MRKKEFLSALRRKLKGLPKREIEERISFYGEMIDDRVDEGCSEEEAVAKIGNVDKISRQILKESRVSKSKRKRKPWEIALFWIGSPLWISLGAAAFAVAISLYASLWAIVISLWAVFVALVATAIGGAVISLPFAISGNTATGIAILGAALVCGGVAILGFYGCKAATKGAWWLTKKSLGIKKCFRKKETRL